MADTIGAEVKYGGGPEHILKVLTAYSGMIANFEEDFFLADDEGLPLNAYRQMKEVLLKDIAKVLETLGKQEIK